MGNDSHRIDELFCAALELGSADARRDFLQRQSAGDDELRRRLEQLINAHFRAGDFMEGPTEFVPAGDEVEITESPGSTIGRYRLLEQIGEGGFGVVFLADQVEPVKRRVALKVIKQGMDTRKVVARFEAERQTLALMDHPGIAKVFDAGATDTGRPFFVMELVKGEPITQFCDGRGLGIRERLELFQQVCRAIQHAHQKAIIHRDIKPSNVLVIQEEAGPRVKVIDFGIAKAMEAPDSDRTLFTELRQMVGTPSYMSPEQADCNLDIDTRSDVYSLGVLLYELLTGKPPFDPRKLQLGGFAEMQRIIREVEPLPPSTRLSSQGKVKSESGVATNNSVSDSATIAKNRNLPTRKLISVLRSELDWVVLRCLEKDRSRRYQSASGLAADIDRYLTNQAVEARPAGWLYRVRKFSRRNKGLLAAAILILLSLCVGIVGSTWQALRATHAEAQALANEQQALGQAARAEAISEFLVQAFRSPDPLRDGRSITIVEVLDRTVVDLKDKYEDQPAVRATLLNTLGNTYIALGLPEDAIPLLEETLSLRRRTLGDSAAETIATMVQLATQYSRVDRDAEAVAIGEQALELHRQQSGEDAPETILAMQRLSSIYRGAERAIDGIPLAMAAVEKLKASKGPEHYDTLVAMHEAIAVHGDALGQGENVDFPFLFEDIYPIVQRQLPEDHPFALTVMDNLAYSAIQERQYDYAGELLEKLIALRLEKLGPTHHATLRTIDLICTLSGKRVDPRKAMKDLELVANIAAENPEVKAAKANVEARLRPFDSLVDDYVKRIEEAADAPWTDAPRKLVCRELAEMPDVFEAVAERLPEELCLWIGRGQYYIQRDQFAEAEADYARVLSQRPFHDEYYEYGCLLLLRDETEYQEFCRELYEQDKIPEDGYSAYVATRLFGIGPAKCVPPKELTERADFAARDRTSWQLNALGVTYLHTGKYKAACKILRELVTDGVARTEHGETWYPLAVANYKLGDVDEGRRCLQLARRAYHNAVPPRRGEPAFLTVPSAWLLMRCLASEAENVFVQANDTAQEGPSAAAQ